MPNPTIHQLKTKQPHFNNLWIGIKTFEVREKDRDFKAGDYLVLREYYETEMTSYYGERFITAYVSLVFDDPEHCKQGKVIMAIHIVKRGYDLRPDLKDIKDLLK